jgi:tetratricopeptide (TPR) repeat protein
MLATKNRAGALLVSLLAMAVMFSACAPPGPRALLDGKELLEAGQTAAAIAELRTATTLMPTNAAAWNYLGVAYHRSGQWTNAAAAYSQALRFNRDLLDVRFNLGCLWLDQNNPEAAKADLFTYTSRRPNDGVGWVKLGSAQLQTRELLAAEKSFREALRVDAKDVVAMNGLGLVFAQRNRPREAAETFAAVVKLQPDYRPALLNLATMLQQQNDRAGALQRYREYLALQPRDADWEAVSAIARALEPAAVAPPRPAPLNPVVVAAAATNQVRPLAVATPRPAALAKPEVQTNVTKPPTAAPAVPKVISNAAPPAPEVVKLAPEPVIKTTPDDKPVISSNPSTSAAVASPVTTSSVAVETVTPQRKRFLSKLNPFRRETKPAAEPGTTNPNPPIVSTAKGTVPSGRYGYVNPAVPQAGERKAAERELAEGQEAQRAKRLAEAIQHYRRAAAVDGSYFEAHYSVGLVAFEMRNFKAAAAAWETAIAIRPDSADARYNFALTLKAAGHPQDAADELEKLLALHPDEARGHLTLGNLYAERLGDKPRARLHYNRVLQLDPRNPQAQAIRYWLVANPG